VVTVVGGWRLVVDDGGAGASEVALLLLSKFKDGAASTTGFPWVLDVYDVAAHELFKVIEMVVRTPGLP
jgi:hypothetical protein